MPSPTAPAPRKRASRKSIAFQPSSSMSKPLADDNKENGGSASSRSKKSRSKSLGPGELQNVINNEQKDEKTIKSILQPAIPISPLQQIPVFNARASKIKALAPAIMVPLKTEQEQQEARQQREAQRSAAMNHREKRRKSLGGRRVSFNPEVTMHVLEELQVSRTPSTADSNSTAKTPSTGARSPAAATPTPANNIIDTPSHSNVEDVSSPETPATPPKQVEKAAPEPESARLEHKKENRRPPATPMNNFEEHTQEFTGSPTPSSVFSSPAMTDDAESVLAPEDSSDEDDTGLISVVSPSVTVRTDASDDDSDDMDIVDENEPTATFTPWIAREHNHPRLSHPETNFTSAPPRPQDSNPEMPFSGRRHDHPRLSHPETGFSSAPRRAELMRQDEDNGEDATMEITRVVGQGVLSSPSPARISNRIPEDDMTMEFTQAIGPGILSNRRLSTVSEATSDGDMTMEITRAIGAGLLSTSAQEITYPSLPRMSLEQEDDQTMELTRAIGGIVQSHISPAQSNNEEDEDMSMELTKVIGGVLQSRSPQVPEPESENTESMDMDMTIAIGGIIREAIKAPASEPELQNEPTNASIATDIDAFTMHPNPSLSALVAEARARSESVSSNQPAPVARTPTKTRRSMTPQKKAKEATPRSMGRMLRSRTGTPQVGTPEPKEPTVVAEPPAAPATVTEPEVSTPKASSKKAPATSTPKTTQTPTAPPKTTTPKPTVSAIKAATPKTTTPRRSARTPQVATPTPKATTLAGSGKVAVLDHGLSAKRRLAGVASPGVHLTNMNSGMKSPSKRATGVGISKVGMGSPSVRRILSARKSLGKVEIDAFSPGVRPLSQLLKDLKDDNKDSGDADDEAAKGAAGIKEMLERMTPKKDAKAAEPLISLEGSSRPKRTFDAVKGDLMAAASAVPKNLEQGPTGSPARKKRRSLETEQPTTEPAPAVRFNVPEAKENHAPRPNDESPFAPSKAPVQIAALTGDESENDSAMDVDSDADIPKMAMKDFLSMIGISFMDGITSTRHRRQTGAIIGLGVEMPDEDIPMGDQINGQLTIRPFLELYEHLQRELKRSNKEGKEMFRQIEKMVLEENPRLFREYLLAPPDVRNVMDLQFKNIKSSSRLEARGDWYNWRQGLQETLKAKAQESLVGLRKDEKLLEKRREIVDQLQPMLAKKHAELVEKVEVLKVRKEEIDACDPTELTEKRNALQLSKKKLEEKKAELEKALKLQEKLDKDIVDREERKAKLSSDIESAEKVAEANKGFTEEEVLGSISRVRDLEQKTGWTLTKAEAPCYLEMSYKKMLEVRFDAHKPSNAKHPATLKLLNTPSPSVQQSFFIQVIESSCQSMKFGRFQDLLKFASERWDKAVELMEEIKRVQTPYPNSIVIGDNGNMVFTADMLIMQRKAKVRVSFTFPKDDVMGQVDIRAEKVYGEGMKGWKLDEFLQRVVQEEGMKWWQAMRSLGRQLGEGAEK